MSVPNTCVAIYKTHHDADDAVKELQSAGFDMKRISVIGNDYHTDEHVVGYHNTGDRMKAWGKSGAFWGGLLRYPWYRPYGYCRTSGCRRSVQR